MKKRMLITTIVMLLVLAVALTTSSLAWFSASQATVTATGGSFTATTSNSVVALGISKTNSNFGDSITFSAKEGLNPLCMTDELKTALDAEGTTVANLENEYLNSVLVKTVGGIESFYLPSGAGSVTNALLSGSKLSSVYVTNQEQGSIVKDLKVNAHVTVPDKDNNLVMLITYSNVEGDSDLGVISGYIVLVVSNISGKNTYTIHTFDENDHNVAITTASDWAIASTYAINSNTVADEWETIYTLSDINLQPSSNKADDAVHTVRLDIYAWYDGVELKSTTSGATTLVDFQFEGVSA